MGNSNINEAGKLIVGAGATSISPNINLDSLSEDEIKYLESFDDEFQKEYKPSTNVPNLPPELPDDFFINQPKNTDLPIPIIKIKNFIYLLSNRIF